MTRKIKRIGLTLGLFSSIISFIFFGRNQDVNQLFLLSGIIISLIFYLTILLGKETIKSKIIWTILVALAVTIQRLAEPILIKGSYLIYLSSNEKNLIIVNNILKDKSDDISIHNDKIYDKTNLLSQAEKDSLLILRRKLNVYMITKTDNEIYYGLWGFLDVRLGISYWTKSEEPNETLRHLKEKWYY